MAVRGVRWRAGGAARPVRRIAATADWPYAAGAVVLCLWGLLGYDGRPPEVGDGVVSPVAFALVLAVTLPVVLARVAPVAAAALITVGVASALLAGLVPPWASAAALAVPLYRAARFRPRRTALTVVAPLPVVVAVPFGVPAAAWLLDRGGRVYLFLLLASAVVAVAAGLIRRAVVDTARREATDATLRESLVEHVARGERVRIARELHDVVAHHISMIAVQAETARLATPGMPPEGAKRLLAIGDTARTALTEMRRLLGVLREDGGEAESTRRPQPGLQQLSDLIDEARALSAASTRLIVRGRVAALDPGVELNAYRIVQEALTNVRRHAPGAAVDVELDYRAEGLHLRIRDNGPGPSAPGEGGEQVGHGLAGMRERVAMVGGRLTARPGPATGFVVDAFLPAGVSPHDQGVPEGVRGDQGRPDHGKVGGRG